MARRIISIALFLFALWSVTVAQPDLEPPVSPVLENVTVLQPGEKARLTWTLSSSADTEGYIVYFFKNGEGFPVDTLWSNTVTEYTNLSSFAGVRSESYVVAAIDTAGNVSPLSNPLSTIFLKTTLDTCNNRITVEWNSYASQPAAVNGYEITVTENGSVPAIAGSTGSGENLFHYNGVMPGSNYCFTVTAKLQNGNTSISDKSCSAVSMVRPPLWINLDYVTVTEGRPLVHFSFDQLSELKTFRIYRKLSGENDFTAVSEMNGLYSGSDFKDMNANPSDLPSYRVAAVNNCNNSVVWSNDGSLMLLEVLSDEKTATLKWTKYYGWRGGVGGYDVQINTSGSWYTVGSLPATDTTFVLQYKQVMNEVTGGEICFMTEATEITNIYGVTGVSRSGIVCIPTVERITVPNAFTPDGNSVNDLFKPVLSFTPTQYRLIISDLNYRVLFETEDSNESWDGKKNGAVQPAGVYIWSLSLTTPSGKKITRTGTVTVL